jgi:acyl-CoA dehydrogenase
MIDTLPSNNSLAAHAKDFAQKVIFPRRQELIKSAVFPDNLWQAFARSGLAGLSVPKEFGGSGASYQILSSIGQILNREGGVPGVGMVFMSHWQLTKLHLVEVASMEMKQDLLPKLAAGETTLSVAISEPGAGAHPKLLKTSARREGDKYILNGEKAFLTNGPLADYFIVLAITTEDAGKKKFSALLVPAGLPGFQKTDGVKIDFLHPCPHGGLKLMDCQVPASNMIGVEGEAFIRTSLRMRALEDAVGAASHVGSMQCLLKEFARQETMEIAAEIGAAATLLQALDVTAHHLATLTDHASPDLDELMELQLGHRQQSQACAKLLNDILQKIPEPVSEYISLLNRDIQKYHSIAESAHAARLKKIGQSIIHKARQQT